MLSWEVGVGVVFFTTVCNSSRMVLAPSFVSFSQSVSLLSFLLILIDVWE